MLNDFLWNVLIVIFWLGMPVVFGILFYMILFEAEKMRQKMVALPEYKPTWVFWATTYKPFKWWHFYRKGVFICQIDSVFISKREMRTSIAARKIIEIMPHHLKILYKIQAWIMLFVLISAITSHFLH